MDLKDLLDPREDLLDQMDRMDLSHLFRIDCDRCRHPSCAGLRATMG